MVEMSSLLSAGRCNLHTPLWKSASLIRLCRTCSRRSTCSATQRVNDHPIRLVNKQRNPVPSLRGVDRQQRCQVEARATLQGSLVSEPRATGGARELLTWISELPWARVAIWLTVALTASQFHDFFGVRSLRVRLCTVAAHCL